ncbi:MAG: F0F1 ATP synthase subunit delta [Sarcina sp.]
MDDQLIKSYALAIYDIAEENNKVDKYLENLNEICSLITKNSDLHNFIESPKISTKVKKDLIRKQLIDQVDKDLLSFLLILIEKNLFIDLNEVLDEMRKIYLEKHNQVTAVVTTVTPLTEEQKAKLKVNLEAKYNKKIILKTKIDKSILGGIFIKANDEIIDGTFKTKYDELRALMLKK